jgi:hypothetical protein
MEKPSCIKKLKQLANTLTNKDVEATDCIEKLKAVIDNDNLSANQKILKLKELCKNYVE